MDVSSSGGERMHYKNLISTEINEYIEDIAKLRIKIFHDYPYLYDGDLAYERKYLQTYVNSKTSLVSLAMDGERLVGATSCIPMKDEWDDFKAPFIANNIDPTQVFYFGESILLPEYRGKGIGKEFFTIRESHAKAHLPSLKYTAFCSVIRPKNHPLKPKDYRPLDAFWSKMAYQKQEDLQAKTAWKDLDKTKEDTKSLVFWLKNWD